MYVCMYICVHASKHMYMYMYIYIYGTPPPQLSTVFVGSLEPTRENPPYFRV